MTKTIAILLLAIVVAPTVYGQISTDTLFTIAYQPSFHNPSQLTIYNDKDGSKGLFQTISIIEGKVKIDTAIANLPDEISAAYSNFLSAYTFPGYIDNKVPGHNEQLCAGLRRHYNNWCFLWRDKRLFRFWSRYHDRESMALFKMTLSDLEKDFKTGSNKKYFKWLKKYAK